MSTPKEKSSGIPSVSPLYKPVVYMVKPGDTLSQILANFYHANYGSYRYEAAKILVLYHNQQITNPDALQPKQPIRLMPMTPKSVAMCSASDEQNTNQSDTLFMSPLKREYLAQYQSYIPTDPREREAFWSMAWLQENYNWLSGGLGAAQSSLSTLLHESNTLLLKDVESVAFLYQRGHISKGQYENNVKQALSLYSKRVGPFEKLLLKGQTTQQALQIARSGALPLSERVAKNLGQLNKLAKLTKLGGVALTGANLGMGCYQIAHTQSRQKKNEIFVNTIGSTIVGSALGYALGVFLVSTPVGWVTALAIGAASALASYGAGEGAEYVYDKYLNKIDFASMTRVDQICR